MSTARAAAAVLAFLAVAAAAELPESIEIGPYLTHLRHDGVTVSVRTRRPSRCHVDYSVGAGPRLTKRDEREAVYHDVALDGLPAGAACRYRVVVDGEATPEFGFTTAAVEPVAFRFAKYGDTCAQRRVALAIARRRPAFVVHTGDFVPQGERGRRFGELLFEPARELLATCPLLPTLGDNDRRAADVFADYFCLPPKRLWQAWRFGDVALFCLDAYAPLGPDSPQGRWLAEALAASRARWKIVALQEPLYSCGKKGADAGVRRQLLPLLLARGVDLVLAGDEHSYERTHAIGVGEDPSANGIVHVISGGGGQPLRPVVPESWTAFAASRHHFCIFDVQGDALTISAYSDADELLDRFTLSKKDGRRAFGKAVSLVPIELILYRRKFPRFRFPRIRMHPRRQRFEFTVTNAFDVAL